jgi:hypothetical protein
MIYKKLPLENKRKSLDKMVPTSETKIKTATLRNGLIIKGPTRTRRYSYRTWVGTM